LFGPNEREKKMKTRGGMLMFRRIWLATNMTANTSYIRYTYKYV